jgi:fumarylacetoacetase
VSPWMLAHHTSGGCNMVPGDLFGTGTISAADPRHSGCLLEITANGANPIRLRSGEERQFLEDDVVLTAHCVRDGFRRIGFGECRGRIVAGG